MLVKGKSPVDLTFHQHPGDFLPLAMAQKVHTQVANQLKLVPFASGLSIAFYIIICTLRVLY